MHTLTRTRSVDMTSCKSYGSIGPVKVRLGSCRSAPGLSRHRVFVQCHFLHRRPTPNHINNARRAHLQYASLSFKARDLAKPISLQKRTWFLKGRRCTRSVQFVGVLPVFIFTGSVCSLQHSHKPVNYLLPRSRLYYGTYMPFFSVTTGIC